MQAAVLAQVVTYLTKLFWLLQLPLHAAYLTFRVLAILPWINLVGFTLKFMHLRVDPSIQPPTAWLAAGPAASAAGVRSGHAISRRRRSARHARSGFL